MKLLFNIDQIASLTAGLDAPHSTMSLDISPASIPADIRALVMSCYDIASGKIEYKINNENVRERGYVSLPTSPKVRPLLVNATEQDAIDSLTEFAAQITQRQAEHVAVVKAAKIEAEAAAVEAEQKLQATIAGILDGSVTISYETTGGGISPNSGSNIPAERMTPELTAKLQEWKDAKAKAQAERDAAAAKAKAEREARQINGKDVHEWDNDQGTIDMSTESGIPYDSHRNARNWVATVSYGGVKGKFNRSFWGGKGKSAEIPSNLKVGDYLEGGSKDKKGRNEYKYVRVLEITETTITVRESGSPGANPPDVTKEVAKLEAIRATLTA
jgi:hypothetical protein